MESDFDNLIRGNNLTPPEMPFSEAKQTLIALDDSDANSPLKIKATMSVLKYLVTPFGLKTTFDSSDYTELLPKALKFIAKASENAISEFLAILFNLAHPSYFRQLRGIVFAAVSSDTMEKLIIENLSSENEFHVFNALHAPYYIYGHRKEMILTEGSRARINELVKRLSLADRKLNPLLRSSLQDLILPANL